MLSDGYGVHAMASLIAASAFFLLIHFGVSGTRVRDVLVSRIGDRLYRGVFAVASLLGIVWMAGAYSRAATVILWNQLISLRPLAYVLVFIAFLFVVIGVATPNPTTVGMESKLTQSNGLVRGITRITRHPFLWGVALWALVHLVVNGDLASLILFGSLLVLSLAGTAAIDAKRRRKFADQWARFAQATSNVPFAAIVSSRNQLGPAVREIGILRPVLAISAYAVAFVLHGRVGPPLV
jgi:uncharacterized membrane protein